jgi:hypothetical protein
VEAFLFPALARIEGAAARGAVLYQSTVEPDDGMGWPESIFISVGIAGGCALIAVIIWQVFLTARKSIETKASEQTLEEMRALAQRSIAANEVTSNELAKLSQGVTDLRVRLEGIEKVLREVE